MDADDARLLIVLQAGPVPPTDGAASPADLSVFIPAALPLPADALAALQARRASCTPTSGRPPPTRG